MKSILILSKFDELSDKNKGLLIYFLYSIYIGVLHYFKENFSFAGKNHPSLKDKWSSMFIILYPWIQRKNDKKYLENDSDRIRYLTYTNYMWSIVGIGSFLAHSPYTAKKLPVINKLGCAIDTVGIITGLTSHLFIKHTNKYDKSDIKRLILQLLAIRIIHRLFVKIKKKNKKNYYPEPEYLVNIISILYDIDDYEKKDKILLLCTGVILFRIYEARVDPSLHWLWHIISVPPINYSFREIIKNNINASS